jgi:hypothetical protein
VSNGPSLKRSNTHGYHEILNDDNIYTQME